MAKNEPPTPDNGIEMARKLVKAYGEVLERKPGKLNRVVDASELPAPKSRIRAALFQLLTSVSNSEQKEFLKAGLMRLAFFQEGVVGTADLDAPAADEERWREVVESEVSALKLELFKQGHGDL